MERGVLALAGRCWKGFFYEIICNIVSCVVFRLEYKPKI